MTKGGDTYPYAESESGLEAPELVDLGSAIEIIQGGGGDCCYDLPGQIGNKDASPDPVMADRYDDLV